MSSVTLEAIRGTNTYNLSDGSLVFRVEEDGAGMAPTRRLTEQGPFQHGATDLGFRLNTRTLTMAFGAQSSSLDDLYDNRDQLLDIFTPTNDPIRLRYTLPGGDKRQIDAHYLDGMTFATRNRQGFFMRVALQLTCPDPTFYDPDGESVTFGLSVGTDAFDVPMSVPTGVGASGLDQNVTVNYAGNWIAYPIITVNGPVTDLVITNETTDEALDFTGLTLGASEQRIIDTRYGVKTVVDENGDNQIDDLSEDSDLATFHLERAPVASGGINDINVTGTGADPTTEIFFQWNTRYIGI